MRSVIASLVLVGGPAVAGPALATWSATETTGGRSVREGDIFIAMPDEGSASATARRLDKAAEGAEKRAEKADRKGVVSRPGTPCPDPKSGLVRRGGPGMSKSLRAFRVAAALLASAAPLAAREPGPWRAETTAMGTTVSSGEGISFRAPDQEAGEEMADALNDADRKPQRQAEREEKQGDGKKPSR